MTNQLNAAEVAQMLGFPNAEAFEYACKDKRILPPDGVFAKLPYWRRETVQQMVEIQVGAIRNAFGYSMPENDAEGIAESEGGDHD